METRYFLELATPPDADLREQLLASGALLESALTGWALPSEQVWQDIEAALKDRQVEHDLFYEYAPTATDDDDELAAFLPLTALSAAEPVTPGQLIALRDEETSSTVASERLVDLLAPVTTGLEWQPIEGSGDLLRLTAARPLPEPVVVPHAVFRSKGMDGRWAVQSDGRELLTDASRKLVREAGAAFAPECVVDGDVLPWLRPLLVSRRVLRVLTEHDVQGVAGAPVYLGTA
jgi:hypothetical protein